MKNLTTLILATVFLFQSCGNGTEKKVIKDNTFHSERGRDSVYENVIEIMGLDTTGNDPLNDVGCKISLSLFYENNVLKYQMETSSRELSGNAELTPNEEQDGYYITFKNIEWSEYLGNIDQEDEENSNEDLPLPQDIEGVLDEDGITIQNTGNAMNYYVKLRECDAKYIHLVKDKRTKSDVADL